MTERLKQKIEKFSSALLNYDVFDESFFNELNDYLSNYPSSNGTTFFIDCEWGVYEGSSEEKVEFCNTIILPIKDITIYYLDRVERYLEVICFKDGDWQSVYLTPSQLRSDSNWLRKSLGFKAIYYCKYKELVEYIDTLCPLISAVHVYTYVGWAEPHRGIYITGSGAIGNCNGLNILPHDDIKKFQIREPEIDRQEAVKTVLDLFLDLGTHDFTYTALSFTFLSCYKSLLDELPQKPEFLYYIHGQTGSRKTTVSKLFFNPFHDWEEVPINFTATKPAMELTMVERRDTVTLIDDIPPSTNTFEKRNIETKVEAIFRSVGDSVGRQKMSSRMKKTEMKPQGLVAITAEDNIVKSASSQARGFFVQINRDTVDLKKLSKAQASHDHYSAAIYYFIEYISTDITKFTKRVVRRYQEYEKQFAMKHSNAHGRHIASAAWLQTSFHELLRFASKIHVISDFQKKRLLDENEEILDEKLKEMIKETDSNNEVELFVRAAKELIATKTIVLADIELKGKKKIVSLTKLSSKPVGYRDADYIYFLPESAFSLICSHYTKQQKLFPVTTKTLWTRLCEKKLLVPDRNQDGTRTIRITVNDDRISVIRIDRRRFESWGENLYEADLNNLPGSLVGSLQYR